MFPLKKLKVLELKIAECFLRVALSAGFLSAVADRFGLWPKAISAWGNWHNFADYTKSLVPFALSNSLTSFFACVATGLEIVLGVLLLTNFKSNWIAKASSALLLLFAISMTLSKSIKAPLDYSVFTAASAAFALSIIVNLKTKNESPLTQV